MRIVSYVLLLIIILLGVSFAVLNAEPVLINYYVGKHTLPLSLLLVFVFSLGGLLGLLVGGYIYLKQKAKTYKLQNRVKLIEKELANLRTIPLKDNR